MHDVWSSELETGIEEIDTGNRKLVEHIKNLNIAKQQGNREVLVNVVEQLLDHVCNQFLLEEHMMQEAGYEFHGAHEKVHELFARKLADFRGRVQGGESPFDEVVEMLDHWVDGHVKNEDQMYAETVLVKIQKEGGSTWVKGLMKKLFG